MSVPLASLVVRTTKEAVIAAGLALADTLGLPVSSWSTGNPTRSLYYYLAEVYDALEEIVAGYIAAGFLDYAVAAAEEDSDRYDQLVLLADQVYGYTVTRATYATGTITLTNAGGGLYVIEAGDLTFKDSTTEKTFHNTSGGTLASGPGTTLTLDIVADESGSDSTSGAGDIDTMVVTLLEVTCSNAAAVVGLDDEEPSSIAAGCRAKLGAISPNGPADAFSYVALNSELTGTTGVTRCRVNADSTTGDVEVLLAGPSGAVSAGDVTAVEAAIVEWAAPLCITPAVSSAANETINVTYSAWGYDTWGLSTADAADAIEDALIAWFKERPIAGDVIPPATTGTVDVNMIEAAIKSAAPTKITKVVVTVPASAVTIAADHVPVCGTVTPSAPFHYIPEP